MVEQKRDVNALVARFPLIKKLQAGEYVFWVNDQLATKKQTIEPVSMEMIREAEQKLQKEQYVFWINDKISCGKKEIKRCVLNL